MLNFILKNRRWIGVCAIIICIWAWSVELAGWTYVCPFCRVQRTVIGILGLLLLAPIYGHWLTRYVSVTLGFLGFLGFLGAHVAASQHFRGWRRISSGEYEMHTPFHDDSFLLSGAALFILSALILLLWIERVDPVTLKSDKSGTSEDT